MKHLFLVFLGGGAGSVLRYLLSAYTQKLWTIGVFPLGTFLVNLLGCLLIGALSSGLMKTDETSRLLLIVGFCGGFTTFSAFSAEGIQLWQSGHYLTLTAYILLSVLLGITAVWAGAKLTT